MDTAPPPTATTVENAHRPLPWAHAALVLLAVVAWWVGARGHMPVGAVRLPAGAAAVLLVGGRFVRLEIRAGRRRFELSGWAPATVLVAATAPRGDLVPIAVVAALAAHVASERRATKPLGAALAAASAALSAAAAAEVLLLVAPITGLASTTGWVAVVSAALVAELTEAGCGLVGTGVDQATVEHALVSALASGASSAAAAVVAVDAATSEPWSLAVAAAFPAAAMAAQHAHRRLAGRHANLEALYGLTQRLAGLSEEHDVLREVLLGLQQALSCRRAQLLVQRRSGALRYELDETLTMTVQEVPKAAGLLDLLVEGREALLAPRGSRHLLGEALETSGFTDAMVVRLPGDAGDPRILVVADRTGGGTFGPDDLPFLQTLAAQCAVSLRGTRLLDELRSEVASREHDALHDSLTRLGNRALFARRCEEALAKRRPNSAVVVMLMDLDGFKEINDTLGHHVGDLVLQEVARRLRTAVSGRGVPTRLGGDEFAIVYPGVGANADVRAVAHALSEAISQPMEVGELALTVQASIGISLAPGHGSDASSLLKCADVAMYAAKSSSQRVAVYNPSGDQHSTRRLLLASELRRAAEAEELVLNYQPKADLRTGAVLGFEALLRWSHPSFGEVPPSEFIPVAEQAGLIDGMTWWVLTEALRQQRVWAAAGFDISVAVNISARSLLDGRLAQRLERLLASSGVPPERLILEVTESSVMADAERSAAILDSAAALGVRISVDDFGTGYSSLSRLLEMPVHEIKVDRSFVTTMLQSADNMAIVQSTVNLALSMQRKVTAEGVEDEGTWETLRQLGCHAAQGYALARPMTGDRTLLWLAQHEQAMAEARAAGWEAEPEEPAPALGHAVAAAPVRA